MIRRAFGFVLLVGGLALPALAQPRSDIRIETTRLAEDLFMLRSGRGGNLAVHRGPDGLVLVDAEYAALAGPVKEALASLGDRPVKILVNTHWHFDHVGGNEGFARAGATIVAHENVRKRMAVGQQIAVINRRVPAAPPAALPTITFTDRVTLHHHGETIEVRHIPDAHTDGDSVVRFQRANVIHAGDIFFHGGYPFIDVSAGGSIDGVIAAVGNVLALCNDQTRIIPGHGPLAKKADLEAYHVMLQEFRAIVAREIAAGKDLPAVLAARPTAALDRIWGVRCFPPEKFTEIVFRSLRARDEATKSE